MDFKNHILIFLLLWYKYTQVLLLSHLLATKMHPINLRHVNIAQSPKLALIFSMYQECDRREDDNKRIKV